MLRRINVRVEIQFPVAGAGATPILAPMPDPARPRLGDAGARRRVMAEYDGLSPPLRRWLAGARLQWLPASARRAWRRALWRSLGRERAALARMDALEEAALSGETDTS